MPAANGEDKQLIKKKKGNPDEASLASELSSSSSSCATEKKEEYENLPSDLPAVADQEERGPIKDRSCTDVLCLGMSDFSTKFFFKRNCFTIVPRFTHCLSCRVGRYKRKKNRFRPKSKWSFVCIIGVDISTIMETLLCRHWCFGVSVLRLYCYCLTIILLLFQS